jgi:hypothetical protein
MAGELVMRALRDVWAALSPLQVPMAVMGGLALAAWRYVRATRDVGLLVALRDDELPAVLQRLRGAGIRTKRSPPVLSLGQLDLVQLLYQPAEAYVELQIDVLLAKSEYHREALRRRVLTHLPDWDCPIAVLSCEDLILHKLLAARLIDRVDAVGLLRANRDGVDLSYLRPWTSRLQLTSALLEVWQEAFPDVTQTPFNGDNS